MVRQTEFSLPPFGRGFHLITGLVVKNLPELPQQGLLHLFIKHTSAGLCISENCDPDVLRDFESSFNHIVREGEPFYRHTAEGPDDMPSHIKSVMTGHSLSIPVTNRQLNLGTWQGIYLCEFRNKGGSRKLVATVYG